MRIALDFVAVHVGARIAFVRIADDIFLVCLDPLHHFPFDRGRKAGATAPAEFRALDLFEHVVLCHLRKGFKQRTIASYGDVFFNIIGVDETGIAEDELSLAFEEWNFIPGRNARESRTEFNF